MKPGGRLPQKLVQSGTCEDGVGAAASGHCYYLVLWVAEGAPTMEPWRFTTSGVVPLSFLLWTSPCHLQNIMEENLPESQLSGDPGLGECAPQSGSAGLVTTAHPERPGCKQ